MRPQAFALVMLHIVALSNTNASQGQSVRKGDVPDAFKVFAAFPYGVGIMDSDKNTIFNCLTAKRKDFDGKAKTVTYVWSLDDGQGKRKHVGFHHTAGDTPDATNFTIGHDSSNVQVAYFRWSDYKNCAITEVPYRGNQCTLWLSKDVEDSVPPYCIEEFHNICGAPVSLRDSQRCQDDEEEVEDY